MPAPSPSPDRAGYRFGTTLTRQSPFSRSAYTSGGVRSSCPAANGSLSGSIGSRGATSRKAPGREPRSPATITRRPVSGSMRSSGKALLHGHVLDALLHEGRSVRARTRRARRAAARRSARAARSTPSPPSAAIRSASREDLGGDAVAAAVALHGEPAEPRHLARGTAAGRCRSRPRPPRPRCAWPPGRGRPGQPRTTRPAPRRRCARAARAPRPARTPCVPRGPPPSAGVALDVLRQLVLAGVPALVHERELALRVVERRARERLDRVERRPRSRAWGRRSGDRGRAPPSGTPPRPSGCRSSSRR